MPKFTTIDEYFAAADPAHRPILEEVRTALLKAVALSPDQPEEKIRYDMPAVIIDGRYAIHYAAWKQHLGLYPVPRAPEPLESEIAPHRSKTDTVNFPWKQPIDIELIG